MNSRTTVTILATLAIASLSSCANEAAVETEAGQLIELRSLTVSPDDVSTSLDIGGVFLDRFQARRRAVLSLWVDGEPLDRIAAKTGYKIDVVITAIENFRDDYRNHQDQIDEFPYPEYLTED